MSNYIYTFQFVTSDFKTLTLEIDNPVFYNDFTNGDLPENCNIETINGIEYFLQIRKFLFIKLIKKVNANNKR